MKLKTLRKFVKESKKIVFFGGAGVSTASNIPDFRGEETPFSNQELSPEEILSNYYFFSHTKEFYNFYKNHMIYLDAKPNGAHLALAKLEKEQKLSAVITQNIDGLHQAAGSKNVLELHGSVHENYCLECGAFYNLQYIMEQEEVPKCVHCGGLVKPNVVLYGEGLNNDIMAQSIKHCQQADLLIVGGTSLTVYPAAGLIRYYRGDRLVLINKTTTPYDQFANIVITDPIDEVLQKALK